MKSSFAHALRISFGADGAGADIFEHIDGQLRG
jgi:hypothetical protein